ncbi:MAG: di-trans,poly-cis-decaprenylcistransferase [Candidatus Sungbacteria bacterium]|nr:di-trans,poly-cis-decaprenylcistransferase [Candidatus Sungbacteria bacterium]
MSIPKHLGLVIDGNRRWAVKNGLSKLEGHHYGAEALKKIIPVIIKKGIPVVSIYTFSTENWRRTAEEVSTLMSLIARVFRQYFDWFKNEGARVRISGRVSDFPEEIQKIFAEAVEATKDNTSGRRYRRAPGGRRRD